MGNASSAADDTKEYREGYPGAVEHPDWKDNVLFYSGDIPTQPGGDYIDKFHTPAEEGGWRGNYTWLESDHSYIQWLFPIRERGLNSRAQILQKHEAETIAASEELRGRFVKSYETMLDFYGMKLTDNATGAVARKDTGADGVTFERCYANLNSSMHNYLRITRILKALGEVGLEHYKKPFILHVLDEIYNNGHLTAARRSCVDYWAQTLKDDADRAEVERIGSELHKNFDCDVHEYRGIHGFGLWSSMRM